MNDNKQTPPSVILSAEARKQVTEALEAAVAGLEWYRAEHPSANSAADDEAEEQLGSALALLASLPEAPAVEAKPSVQGLANWLRSFGDKPGNDAEHFSRWASAVESLEASRIAPEGQAAEVPEAADVLIQQIDNYGHACARGHNTPEQFFALETAVVALAHAAPQPVPAQADMTDAEIIQVAKKCGAFHAGDYRGYILWQAHMAEGDGSGITGFARAVLSARKERGDALLREAAEHGNEACAALATVHLNHMGETFADVERCFDAAKALYADVAAIRTYLEGK